MKINPQVAVELLEITKYLDETLKEGLNQEFISFLEANKDLNYEFKIDKNIPLYENVFLPETIELIPKLFK